MIYTISVYCDGTVGPEEPAASGSWAFTVWKEDSLIKRDRGPISAEDKALRPIHCEYIAITKALQWLEENLQNRQQVRIYSDNMDVVKQLNGDWEVPLEAAKYHVMARNAAVKFNDLGFTHISKRRNETAASDAEKVLLDQGITPLRLTLRKQKEEVQRPL